MEEILSLVQRARNSILLGESHFREFKTALEGKPGQKNLVELHLSVLKSAKLSLHSLMQMEENYLLA